jgi:hypothetical protein
MTERQPNTVRSLIRHTVRHLMHLDPTLHPRVIRRAIIEVMRADPRVSADVTHLMTSRFHLPQRALVACMRAKTPERRLRALVQLLITDAAGRSSP